MSAADNALRLGPIAAWQGGIVLVATTALSLLGRGSTPSLLAGAGFMLASLTLQRFAVQAAFRRGRSPGRALFFVVLKLALVLGVLYVGLQTALLGPVSFAAGATSLPMAIVADVCYQSWSSRGVDTPPRVRG